MACGLGLGIKGFPFALKELKPNKNSLPCKKESAMAEPYKKIVATVTKGQCSAYKPGDTIVFEGAKMEGNACPFALYALLPVVIAMRYGSEFPWSKDKNVYTDLACPDGTNPVLFEIKRS
jgi:uncharacterized repeat protein (TIGR04076 family)